MEKQDKESELKILLETVFINTHGVALNNRILKLNLTLTRLATGSKVSRPTVYALKNYQNSDTVNSKTVSLKTLLKVEKFLKGLELTLPVETNIDFIKLVSMDDLLAEIKRRVTT